MIPVEINCCQCTTAPERVSNLGGMGVQFYRNACSISPVSVFTKNEIFSKDPATFEWVNRRDAERSVISFIRRNPLNYNGAVLAVISFSATEYPEYPVGVPMGGFCRQVFSSYDRLSSEESLDEAGGRKLLETEKAACNGYYHRILLHLKPFESLIIELPPGNEEAF